MNGYDWDLGFGFGQRYSARQGGGGYGREYRGGYDRSYGRGGSRGFGGQRRGARGAQRGYGAEYGRWQGGGYGQGAYGEQHPTFGGYPGGRRQGMYYGGGREERGGRGWQGRGGYGRGQGGYDQGFARQPFLPEAAYQRHPELNRPQRQTSDRWPAQGHDLSVGTDAGDSDIEQAVRENLYQDSWVDADRIQVSVENGVVTLQGEVNDYLEARYAWDDAWNVEGVRGVINQITVRTDQPAAEGHEQTVLQTAGREGEEMSGAR